MARARRREARQRRREPAAAPGRDAAGGERLAFWLVAALLLVVPFVFVPSARDPFRLPKLLWSEGLALASLLPLAWRRRTAGGEPHVWRLPALVAAAPLVALALAGLVTTPHPLHVRRALPSLLIGAAALVGWSAGLAPARLRRLLALVVLPGSALALLAAAQLHGLYRPFALEQGLEAERMGFAALAGNPGDLGAYLAAAALIAQVGLRQARGAARAAWGAGLAVCLYGLLATQTLTAIAALAAASLVLWALLLPPRRAAAGLVLGVLALGAATALVPPLRSRLAGKAADVARGDWNALLTFRLDAWRAAAWMVRRRPLAGVGLGAYAAEFGPAKLALQDEGVEFPAETYHAAFDHAHNDVLEVAAELGVPGFLALLWGGAVVARQAWRRGRDPAGRDERAWTAAGLALLAVLALAGFPFRVALVAYPALVFLAWVLRPEPPA